jgi:hypothetical protein
MKLQDEKITLETAKLAKEKGFHVPVDGSYVEYHKTRKGDDGYKKGDVEIEPMYFANDWSETDYSNSNYTMYARPTQALLARWLREVHGIQVYAVSGTLSGTADGIRKYKDYVVHVCVAKSHDNAIGRVVQTAINDARDEEYQTYEAAMERGLQEALKLL